MRRAQLGVLLLALALPLAACGGAAPSLEGVAAAADKVQQAKTLRFAFSWDEPYSTGGEGAIDLARERVSLRMEIDQSRGDIVTGTAELRYIDGDVYMQSPELPSVPGKPWVKLDGQADRAQLPDPSQALDVLKSAIDVEQVGEADVRGVPTTHYRGTIDEGARGITPAGSVVDAWVDADGYLRKMRFRDGEATASIDFFDFGADVDIEAPPADQVADLGELTGGGESG